MKYPKILSITLANGFGFLVFGSILAGCQKSVIHKTGFFTKISKQNIGRIPASTESNFSNFQDSKQIYIYCQLNDLKPKACFNRHLSERANEFGLKRNLASEKLEQIKSENSYDSIEKEVQSSMNKIFMALTPSINKLVEKRIEFCKENATVHMDRCLTQYLKKETFQILNGYQESGNRMNGHEYLFLKNNIESKLVAKLEAALSTIENQQKKKL